ncbi:MAG: hydrogenase assembly protein HupF [Actinobacteria bacterium]|nr:MAG: hydrogenase assembly protein HupF [Actinomycetota bacterium]
MTDARRDGTPGDVTACTACAALALARCFAQGGTLWCWAPGASHHAQHVAVEFVHPVIVGTRALPAVALGDHDATAALRVDARAGDALLVIADAHEPVADTLRRASVWGLLTLWMGWGHRSADAAADHVVWVGEGESARHDGRLVRGYHILWELTHVCFAHPGLLDAAAEPAVCTTCSDEGRLAEVIGAVDAGATAAVRTAFGVETVDTTLVGPVQPGDLVLVHAGSAITLVEP